VQLLPTPAVNDMGAGKTVEAWDDWTARMQAKHGNGNGHGASLSIEALRLLPTPDTGESLTGHGRRGGKPGNGSQSGASLESVARLLPTPTVGDSRASGSPPGSEYRGRSLTDVTVRDGASTPPPSPDGQASSGDPLPGQLSWDVTDPA
jgi:DNA (cytosine-5)-methyltransferase 1